MSIRKEDHVKVRRTLSAVLGLIFAAIAGAQERPGPADPLTAAETERAVAVARDEALHQHRLQAGRFSLVGVELAVLKDSGTTTAPAPGAHRHALVLFYSADRNDGVQVMVDLAAGRATGFTTVRGQSVPIGREEVERAAALALKDAAVKTLLGDAAANIRVGNPQDDREDSVQGLRVVGTSPKDPCSRQRCVDLFFRVHGNYIAGRRVTVNLSTNTVRVTSAG
jgi:hypothetical protein